MSKNYTDDSDAASPGGHQNAPSAGDQITTAHMDSEVRRDILAQDPNPTAANVHQSLGGGGAGGSFSMDPEMVREKAKDLGRIKDDIVDLRKDLHAALRPIHRPADDTPSVQQAQGSARTVTAAIEHVAGCTTYTNDFVTRLHKSVGDVENTEHVNSENIRKQDPGDGAAQDGGFF